MSNIEWTDATWNPVVGCTPVSPGCLNCYAAGMAVRLEGMGKEGYTPRRLDVELRDVTGLPGLQDFTDKVYRIAEVKAGRAMFTGDVRVMDDYRFEQPLRWKKPKRVFVCSMADLFHEAVADEVIAKAFAIMGLASWHTFQVLTKRPERMRKLLTCPHFAQMVYDAVDQHVGFADALAEQYGYYSVEDRVKGDWRAQHHGKLPLPNVWIGTSVENQDCVKRLWEMLNTPAAVRFVSVEPLIGPVDLGRTLCRTWRRGLTIGQYLDWVIVGGESGPNARPCDLRWVRDVVRQCQETDTPVFVKQLGSRPVLGSIHETGFDWPENTRFGTRQGEPVGRSILLNDRKGGDMAEWPEDLRVRQWPQIGVAK